jgi:hypothetical protein
MKGWTTILFYASAILTLRALTASGQGRAGTGTRGVATARYDTRSPASIYTGYGWHAAFAMGGVVHNRRTGYAELVGGVGAVLRTGASEHWFAFATARSETGSFAQVFWLPTLRTGAVTSRAQVKWTFAYDGSGAQKLSVAPFSVTMPVGRWVSYGVATDIAAAEGAPARIDTGLELRVRLPNAAVGVDALRDVKVGDSRLRLFFASLF